MLDDWLAFQGGKNSLYHHLSNEARDLLAKRRQVLSQLTSKEDWLAYQEKTRKTLDQIVGPFPEKTPLNPVITGVIEKPGFRVEKIIYESRPDLYVTAALFIPENLAGKAPGILFCSGHTEDGFRSETYQTMILNLVHKGFIVLAFDPYGQGERQDYLSPVPGSGAYKSSVGGATKQHSYAGAQLFLLGNSLANYMIWDGIRGIDYLISRPEVDGSKIGVTGRSGGGTQSAYIAALDERVAVAAPEAFITSFERLLMSIGPQDAEQNFFLGISSGINHGDLLTVRAPKPALMITTTRDFFSIQGARETFREVKQAYTHLGVEHAIQMVEDDAGHASTVKNREAMYRFFMDAFDVAGSSKDVNHALLSPAELQVTHTGQVASSISSASVVDKVAEQAVQFEEKLKGARKRLPEFLEGVREHARSISGFQASEGTVISVFAGQYQREGYRIEKHFLKGSGDYVVPFLVMVPDTRGPHPTIVVLHPDGKQKASETGGLFESIVRLGYAVVATDTWGTGELASERIEGDSSIDDVDLNTWFASILVNKSIVGVQASDLSLLVRYIAGRADLDAQKIAGVAFGETGNALIHTAVLDGTFEGVALMGVLGTTSSLVNNKYYKPQFIPYAVAGSLRHYDLPDLEAALSPDWLLITNPVDHQHALLDEESISRHFHLVKKAYQADGHPERLSIVRSESDEVLKNWIQSVLK